MQACEVALLLRAAPAPLLCCLLILVQVQIANGQGRPNFTLFGDVRVDSSQIEDKKPVTLDVLLYRGGIVIGRLRVGTEGRYRFMNLSAGLYEVVVEIENQEVARLSKVIAGQYTDDVRLDLNLVWRPTVDRKPKASVISIADTYPRTGVNKTLFQRSTRELERKNYDAAIVTLKELIALDPKDYPAFFEMGVIHFIQKDYEKAEEAFLAALKNRPDYLSASLNLGRVRLARKNYPGAVEALLSALKSDSMYAPTHYFLGEAYLQLKKGSVAVGYFNEALRLDPMGMAEAHLRLATLYNTAGYKDRAALEYEQFLKKMPDYAQRKKLEEYIAANKPKR